MSSKEMVFKKKDNEIAETRKKILFVIDSLAHGGAETLIIMLLRNLLPQYEMHLIVLGKPHTLLKSIPEGTHVMLLNFTGYYSIPKCALLVRRYIKKHKMEVVHS